MKIVIYILILISAFAFNLEVRAEWIERDGFLYMKDSLDAIRDFKVSDDGKIIAITKDNQIIKYDFETGEIKKRCKCESDENSNQFAFVSKDLKTTSIVYNFDTLNNENVAYNLEIINNDDCSRIVKQKMEIPKDYRVIDRNFNFSFIDYISKANILINSINVYSWGFDFSPNVCSYIPGGLPSPTAMIGITMSFELLQSKDQTKLLLIDSVKINSYSYQINDNEVFLSGFNIYLRGELAYPYTFSKGHKSKFFKLNLANGKFQTIGEFNYFEFECKQEFDEKDKYLSYMIENNENKVILVSNGLRQNIGFKEWLEGNIYEEQLHEYNVIDNKFKMLKKKYNYFEMSSFIWQFQLKAIRNTKFNFNYKHKNGLLYSNGLESFFHKAYFSDFFIQDFQNDNIIDSFYINFDYKKVEVYIPKSYNQIGGVLILKDNIICLKKNKYFNNIIDNFGVNKSIVREDEDFNLNSYTNNENLKYIWTIYNEFNQYEFETVDQNFVCKITESGIYNINLKILYNDSIISNITKNKILTVNPKLQADFKIKIDKQYPDIVYLNNRSLGKITKYEWTLDNGTKSNEENISFRKYNETDFKIQLKIYDDLGIDSIVKSINLNDKLVIKLSKIDSMVDNSNNEFMDLVINNDSLIISSIKSNWMTAIYDNSTTSSLNDYEIQFEIKYTNYNISNFNQTSNKLNRFKIRAWIQDPSQSIVGFRNNRILLGISNLQSSKFKEVKNNTDLIFLENNLTIKKSEAFDYITKNNSCKLNDTLYFGLMNITKKNKKSAIDTLYLRIYNFKTEYDKDLSKLLPLTYKVGNTYADNINNQIVGLIRKDSSNNFEIFETNEKLEINRRDFSLPLDMEINEVKLINENKLAISGHKKHQYTKGIGTIVVVDLRDLSYVIKEHNSRPTINNLRKINENYYYAFGDVIGSQGYMIFDKNFDLVRDIRLTDLEGELKDVEYLDNKFYLATEEHYLDTITPFRVEDKYKIRLYMDSVEIDLSDDITSIESNPESNFLIFPNPSADKISVDLGEIMTSGVADLFIYDILGNEIMVIPNYTNKSEIDVSNIPIGTYTIQIQTQTGSVSQRLLINR